MKVRVYTDYDPIRILRGVGAEPTDSLALKSGLSGSFSEIEDSDIPIDRTDRDCWEVADGKVKVNLMKKVSKDNKKSEKLAKKKKVKDALKTLGLNDSDIKEVLGLE